MRAVFALVLIVGLGLSGFAVYMAQGYLEGKRAEAARLEAKIANLPDTVQIYVVTAPKAYGERLRKEEVKPIVWQADSLPEGAFVVPAPTPNNPKDFNEAGFLRPLAERDPEMAGLFPANQPDRYILRRIEAFEPVLAVKVTEPGEDAGLTSRLTKGMRAFAIRVDVSSGVSGFLRPGDRVDVYWTGAGASSSLLGQDVTKLIQSGIRLIAVDQTSDTGVTSAIIARTVTVEATPQQVARLAQAQTTGRLSLSLVGAEDDTVAQVTAVDQNELLGIVEQAPEIIEVEKVCTTKIRRGTEFIEQEIPCTN